VIKGEPVWALYQAQANALSDETVDCRQCNAVAVAVTVRGVGASADLAIYGAPLPGGPFLPLADTAASKTAVAADTAFDCVVGSSFAKVNLANIVGTFKPGEGFTISVTPYVSPGGGRVRLTMG